MRDTTLVARIALAILAAALTGCTARAQEATLTRCGLSVRTPAEWVATPDTGRHLLAGHTTALWAPPDNDGPPWTCGFHLVPPAGPAGTAVWETDHGDPIHPSWVFVRVVDRPFREAVIHSPFAHENDAWYVLGYLGNREDARELLWPDGSGVTGPAPYGCYRQGEIVAPCRMPTAFVGTSRRSVLLWGGDPGVLDDLLATLNIHP